MIIAYVRVSTDEQGRSGAGLEAQRAAILAEAMRRGWAEADITFIEDAGYSAKSLKRPGIIAALDALRAGKADVLVVSKLDRLSRSMEDFTHLLARAAKERWALVALDLNVDTSTPAGEAVAHVIATFAQLERRLIGERTRDALQARRAAGVRLGRPRQMPEEVVRRIERMRSEGATLRRIADDLNSDRVPTSQGGQRWHPSTVRKVLGAAQPGRPRSNHQGPPLSPQPRKLEL